jgi:hypothetical protein
LGGSRFEASPGQIVHETPPPISKITRAKWTGGMAQAVERLVCKCEALSSNPNTKRKIKYLKCNQCRPLRTQLRKAVFGRDIGLECRLPFWTQPFKTAQRCGKTRHWSTVRWRKEDGQRASVHQRRREELQTQHGCHWDGSDFLLLQKQSSGLWGIGHKEADFCAT